MFENLVYQLSVQIKYYYVRYICHSFQEEPSPHVPGIFGRTFCRSWRGKGFNCFALISFCFRPNNSPTFAEMCCAITERKQPKNDSLLCSILLRVLLWRDFYTLDEKWKNSSHPFAYVFVAVLNTWLIRIWTFLFRF